MAERRTENPEVSGSMPLSGISTFCEVAGLASETAQLRYFSEKEITTQGTETSKYLVSNKLGPVSSGERTWVG